MNINYIILAHKNPPQVKRLVETLSEKWTYFYIHIDANIDIIPFKESLKDCKNVVFLDKVERYPGIWGDIGIVKGTLAAMRRIKAKYNKGYTILLSGQDYPLQDNKSIFDFFQNNQTNYIDVNPISDLWGKHGLDRVRKYKINKSPKRGHFLMLPTIFHKDFYQFETLGKLNYLRKNKSNLQILKIFKKRKLKNFKNQFGGSVYWSLPNETLKMIIDFIDKNSKYVEFHENTLCADEIFFQSILMHTKTKVEKSLKIAPSLTYSNWERPSGPLPVTFKREDFNELKIASQIKLWARKFDINQDDEILHLIDKRLLF